MTNLFTSTRIKLTLFYTLTILAISGAMSGLFYFRATRIIENEYQRIEHRWQDEEDQFVPLPPGFRPRIPRFGADDIEHARRQIIIQLLEINGFITIVVAIAGYGLSGVTLKPVQKSMEEQRQFVGDAAHELRTPLTALKTSLEVNLMDKNVTGATRKILKENLEDVENLEALTNSLLKLSKIDDQKLVLRTLQLTEVLHRTVKRMTVLARSKQITIDSTEIDPQAYVWGDMTTLIDLFTILVDNAVKYSPSHTKIVLKSFSHQHMIEVVIMDQGVGIAAEHLDRIFDRFYQVDSSRSVGGFGLGLSLAKRIVDQHRGTVVVKSELGKGTAFNIMLQKA